MAHEPCPLSAGPPPLEDLTPHWPLGPGTCLTPLEGGSINGAYRVQAPEGTFHLRVYRNPRLDRAQREHWSIHIAGAVGVPTPALMATRHGDTLIQLPQGWAALFEVAPGTPLARAALTPSQALELGTFLAELHGPLPPTVPFEVPVLAPPATVERTMERLEIIRAAIQARPEQDEVDHWALQRTQERLAFLNASPHADVAPDLPQRFVHGDYHDGNVFFWAERPAALIDWEQTRLAPRAWEIVRCLHLSLGLQPELGTSFLAGYRRRLALPSEELQMGAALYATLQDRNVWTFESVYLNGNPGPRRFIRPPPYRPFAGLWAEAGLR